MWTLAVGMATAMNVPADAVDWLQELLAQFKLESYLPKFRSELQITRLIHFDCICEEDLTRIGLNQPTTRQLLMEAVREKYQSSSLDGSRPSPGPAISSAKSDSNDAAADNRPITRIVAPGLKCLLTSSELTVFELLGSGALGRLHRAEWKLLTGKIPVAARILSNNSLATTATGALHEEVICELNAMYELQHHNVMRFIGIVTPMASYTLLYEYSELGSLKSCLLTATDAFGEFIITVTMLLTYAVQVLHALKYLELKGYVHGNLAACNIMLASRDQVKVTDYGLARILQPRRDFVQLRGPWFAPENFESNSFTHASDSWMFGVMLWEFFSTGADPWKGLTVAQIRKRICEGERLPKPINCPDSIRTVMTRCWSSQPKDRLRFETILAALNEVPLPVLKSLSDCTDGPLEVKNGDDIIVIQGGADSAMWLGQNQRTGAVGQFPQALVIPPIGPPSAATVLKHDQAERNTGRSNINSVALIDLGLSASSSSESSSGVAVKPAAMAGWTTFESTTDLTQVSKPVQVPVSKPVQVPTSQTTKVPKDGVFDKQSNEQKCGAESVTFGLLHSKNDEPSYSKDTTMAGKYHSQGVEIDVSDCDLLLPAASVTSLSEPCSPAHQMDSRKPVMLRVARDNMSFEDQDGDNMGYCHSLPACKGMERPMWVSSASCENLNTISPQRPADRSPGTSLHFSENLIKASSDSPVYVDADRAAAARGQAPPVPPRDYPKRGTPPGPRKMIASQQHPVIHPILQDGHQRSNTHYWLLPEKMKFSGLAPCSSHTSANHSPYINMTDGQWRRNGSSSKHPRSASGDTVLTNSSVVETRNASAANEESHGSMSEACEKIEKVRLLLGVESVSSDEVLTALTGHQWSVESAVEYLKVEHLFRLGIASRQVCRVVLDEHRWNLESAASALLDQCGNR